YFREDYEYIAAPGQQDVLDEHNGRFCVTPEYPNGIYCYFATVDANWNSAYPYVVGPTFYGTRTGVKVTSITEPVTVYTPSSSGIEENNLNTYFNAFPNPSSEFIAVQFSGLLKNDITVSLYDLNGRKIQDQTILAGSTIGYFDVRTLYAGEYIIKCANEEVIGQKRVTIIK
ncbi:MAG: YHYH protein, partial [Bacteroidota bacterium]